MRRIVSILLLGVLCISTSVASELEIDVNDDAARLGFSWPWQTRDLRFDASLLHHQDEGDVLSFGVHVFDIASGGDNPVKAGLGARLLFMSGDRINADGAALGLGGFVRYSFPTNNRLGIGGDLYFAPDVLSFGDAEQYFQISGHVSYNVVRDGDVYLGVRTVKGEFDAAPDITFDNGLHIGFRLSF